MPLLVVRVLPVRLPVAHLLQPALSVQLARTRSFKELLPACLQIPAATYLQRVVLPRRSAVAVRSKPAADNRRAVLARLALSLRRPVLPFAVHAVQAPSPTSQGMFCLFTLLMSGRKYFLIY